MYAVLLKEPSAGTNDAGEIHSSTEKIFSSRLKFHRTILKDLATVNGR